MRYLKITTLSLGAFLLITAALPVQAASPSTPFDSLVSSQWGSGVFHWLTLFESLAGYTSRGIVAQDGTQMTLTTEDAADSYAYVIKQPGWQKVLTFAKPSAFRSAFVVSSTDNIRGYLVYGSALSETGRSYYGFKVVNNALFGVASGNGTSAEQFVLLLGNLSPTQAYGVEARFYPGKKVTFQVEPMSETRTVTGEITTGLPQTFSRPNIDLMNISVTTKDANRKSLGVSFFEFLQGVIGSSR